MTFRVRDLLCGYYLLCFVIIGYSDVSTLKVYHFLFVSLRLVMSRKTTLSASVFPYRVIVRPASNRPIYR